MFQYVRRVQFAETDLAGIVHFSWMFRYMEEAEHALWRAAGLSVAGSDLGWPRVTARFDFRNPLRFEDEFVVDVRLAEVTTRALHYGHTIRRGETVIGTGSMVAVCVRHDAGGTMEAVTVPGEIVKRLRAVLATGA